MWPLQIEEIVHRRSNCLPDFSLIKNQKGELIDPGSQKQDLGHSPLSLHHTPHRIESNSSGMWNLRSEPGPLHTLINRETEAAMRSDLIFTAIGKIENRYLLSTLTMRAIHKLHIPATRTEDTLNTIFTGIGQGLYSHGKMPAIESVSAPQEHFDTILLGTSSDVIEG